MKYNTNRTLWKNLKQERSQMPNGGAILNVFDGMVGCYDEVIARFGSQADAIAMLESTGFQRVSHSPNMVTFK
jgi:phosphatidate phosphatase PAH1